MAAVFVSDQTLRPCGEQQTVPGTRGSVTPVWPVSAFPECPRQAGRPFIDQPERKDEQLGELHTDSPGRASNPGTHNNRQARFPPDQVGIKLRKRVTHNR